MPTYDYLCEACGHVFEVFKKKPTRPRARKCPQCGGPSRRQISGGGGFLFKGEGFYATDYRSAEYRSRAKGETEKADSKSKESTGKKKASRDKSSTDGKGDGSE